MMNTDKNFSIDKAYNLFIEELKKTKLSSATILAYSADIKQLLEFLNKKSLNNLFEVTSKHLINFQTKLKKKNYSLVSLVRKINAFRKFFKFCHQNNFTDHNPASGLIAPRLEKSLPRILSKMEYRALRDTCRKDPRTYALIELFLQTGLKVSEVANLTIEDIKKDKLIVKSKGLSREIPLTSSVSQALEKYLKVRPKSQSQKIFITKNGTPLLVRNMSTILMRCFREAEIQNASLNSLRHTWIVHQLANGLSLQTVSQLAGHKRVSTTAAYLPLVNKKKTLLKKQLKEL